MKSISRWSIFDKTILSMPVGAEIVSVKTLCNIPLLWAIADNRNHSEMRSFISIADGENIPTGAVHVGSFERDSGTKHFHLFEIEPASELPNQTDGQGH
jgi:hypothetical protein